MAKKSVGSEIYSGAASFGKLRAVFGVIFGTLIGLGLIIGGIFAIAHKTKRTSMVTGYPIDRTTYQKLPIIPPGSCSRIINNKQSSYSCDFMLQYTIKEDDPTKEPSKMLPISSRTYTHPFQVTSNKDYGNLNSVPLYYDPKKPGDASLTKDDFHTAGGLMVGGGALILIFSWISLWIVLRYKFAAAASGVVGAYEMMKGL